MTEMPEEIFNRLLATSLDPQLNRCLGAISYVADYDIPQERALPLLRFHKFISDPQPPYISVWRTDPVTERKWYHSHVNGILGDVRGGLAAAHYHLEQISRLENEVVKILTSSDVRSKLNSVTMATPSTRKIDIEYHAFVLASRRALDYLALALACYFKREASSFRTLPTSIRNTKMPVVEAAVSSAHKRHLAKLAFILADGRKSVRHRIAHYEFVSAGCLNLTANGFFLMGGGEAFGFPMPDTPADRLQEALSLRLDQLHNCVEDMIDSFIKAAAAAEAGNSSSGAS